MYWEPAYRKPATHLFRVEVIQCTVTIENHVHPYNDAIGKVYGVTEEKRDYYIVEEIMQYDPFLANAVAFKKSDCKKTNHRLNYAPHLRPS